MWLHLMGSHIFGISGVRKSGKQGFKIDSRPEMTKMGSIDGHGIDNNGVGGLRGQQHIPSKD